MGFIKTPKIHVPAQSTPQEELPVKTEAIREETVTDYNAKAKNRKTLLSTILSNQARSSGAGDLSGKSNDSTLRQTLG